jgi:hypothetical protein
METTSRNMAHWCEYHTKRELERGMEELMDTLSKLSWNKRNLDSMENLSQNAHGVWLQRSSGWKCTCH